MTALAASDKEAITVVNGDQLVGQVSMRDMVFAASRSKAGEGETVTYR